MENRLALLGIIVENVESVEPLNRILHEYRQYIIGRMGIPYPEKGVNLISVAIDAPEAEIGMLIQSLEALDGVNAQAIFAKI